MYNALRYYGFEDTALVLELFAEAWKVMNFKTPMIGYHKRDQAHDSVISMNDWKLNFFWRNSQTFWNVGKNVNNEV